MSFALYPSDAATAAPSDPPALRPAQPVPTLVEGQGCCQDEEEANISKLGLRPHHPRQGEPEDLLPDAEKRCVTTSPTTIQHLTRATYSGSCTTVTGRSHTHTHWDVHPLPSIYTLRPYRRRDRTNNPEEASIALSSVKERSAPISAPVDGGLHREDTNGAARITEAGNLPAVARHAATADDTVVDPSLCAIPTTMPADDAGPRTQPGATVDTVCITATAHPPDPRKHAMARDGRYESSDRCAPAQSPPPTRHMPPSPLTRTPP